MKKVTNEQCSERMNERWKYWMNGGMNDTIKSSRIWGWRKRTKGQNRESRLCRKEHGNQETDCRWCLGQEWDWDGEQYSRSWNHNSVGKQLKRKQLGWLNILCFLSCFRCTLSIIISPFKDQWFDAWLTRYCTEKSNYKICHDDRDDKHVSANLRKSDNREKRIPRRHTWRCSEWRRLLKICLLLLWAILSSRILLMKERISLTWEVGGSISSACDETTEKSMKTKTRPNDCWKSTSKIVITSGHCDGSDREVQTHIGLCQIKMQAF